MDRREDDRQRLINRRTLLLGGLQLGAFGLLAGRMYWLQVLQSEQYKTLAEDNRINLRLLAPPRGRILDRFGVELAGNRQNYRVLVVPEQTRDLNGTLDRLAKIITIDDVVRGRIRRDVQRQRKFLPVLVAENLTWDEFAAVNLQSPDLPGVQLDVGEIRDYPFGDMFSHVVGYVGAVSEKDLTGDPVLALPGFRVGRNGVERIHDLALRGKAGSSQVEINAFGRIVRELNRKEGQPGADLVLTIDAALQKFTTERLGTESAAVVVMDIHSGDLLSMVSGPGFDPNVFNVGITSAHWRRLSNDKHKPLINKPISGTYPPGSTFKMIVAMAGIEAGVVTPDYHVYCPGHMQFGNNTFHCWKKGGHGGMHCLSALEQSCDVFFYEVSRRIGIDRIADMSHRFGLGKVTGIDIPNEKPGIVPSRGWKKAARGEPWYDGETLSVGIGQGYVNATPLQLAVMTARMANGGYAVTPRVVRPNGETDSGGDLRTAAERGFAALGVSPKALAQAVEGMRLVTSGGRGTARASQIKEPGWQMAGKTGTSQVRRITKQERLTGLRKEEDIPWEQRDHALFVCYAPIDKPRYACCVVVEHGGGGSKVAAPIAADVLRECQRLDPSGRPGRDKVVERGPGSGA